MPHRNAGSERLGGRYGRRVVCRVVFLFLTFSEIGGPGGELVARKIERSPGRAHVEPRRPVERTQGGECLLRGQIMNDIDHLAPE